MPDPRTLSELTDEYPPDVRDDLRRISDRMEFQLSNFCVVAETDFAQSYLQRLRALLRDILKAQS